MRYLWLGILVLTAACSSEAPPKPAPVDAAGALDASQDATGTGADVGATGADAGATDADAGATDADAGATDADAGATDADAGAADAGLICEKAAPYQVDGKCVQCQLDSQCGLGGSCDLTSHTCGSGSSGDPCAACSGGTPKCWSGSCVECLADADCYLKGSLTCDQGSHTCGTGTSTPPTPVVLPPGPATGTCASDTDCTGGAGFTLHCDVTTGLCYDEKGLCDNVAAFCNVAAGSNCTAPSGGLPGVPGLPGGSSSPQCSCPLAADVSATSSDPLPNENCKIAALLDPTVKNCDCTKDPHAPACKITSPLDPNPIDCCKVAPPSGPGNPLKCLSLPPPAASPACFGGILCGQTLLTCIAGSSEAVCGPQGTPGFP